MVINENIMCLGSMDIAIFSFWYLMPYTIKNKSGFYFNQAAELIAAGGCGALKTTGIQKGEQEIGHLYIQQYLGQC